MFPRRRRPLELLALLGALVACAGCSQDMADQPRYEPLEACAMFADGQSSRPLVLGTVARGHLHTDVAFYEGKADGKDVATFPLDTVAEKLRAKGSDTERTRQILLRGRERFNIFCSPCHGLVGAGNGMAVARGFPAPPSFHIPRLREAPPGHFYEVMTNGFGRMSDYADQVPPEDRWAIVAYVRALQLSQNAPVDRLPQQDVTALGARR
jgi:mono/diheme cytochrome c family protein